MTSKLYLFTGGGTGGHVIPTKPVIRELLNRGDRVVFVGSNSGLEESLIADLHIEFRGITTGKLRRYFSFKNVVDMFRVPIGVLQAFLILRRTRPSVVFSKGGYVAFPVVLAAWFMRIPVVAHESDLTPGLATRLCTPFVHTQCVTFEETRTAANRVVLTGTPIREQLTRGDAKHALEWLRLESNEPTLVVVGGSLGAEKINEVVRSAIDELVRDHRVIHVCGSGHLDSDLERKDRYFQFEYIDEPWGDVLALADIVISRAGANSLYELLALRKPNILIPLPLSASRGDQIENAELSEVRGWSFVIPEERLTIESLLGTLDLLRNELGNWKSRLQEFHVPDSVKLILDVIDDAESGMS